MDVHQGLLHYISKRLDLLEYTKLKESIEQSIDV
jgi:hypothetical protein